MQLELFKMAQERMLRRAQMWHAARLACPDYATFRASAGAIEHVISRRLAEEFGDHTR